MQQRPDFSASFPLTLATKMLYLVYFVDGMGLYGIATWCCEEGGIGGIGGARLPSIFGGT